MLETTWSLGRVPMRILYELMDKTIQEKLMRVRVSLRLKNSRELEGDL
jgi:small nuclear ribonucleoprotein (snRNP)-like protein